MGVVLSLHVTLPSTQSRAASLEVCGIVNCLFVNPAECLDLNVLSWISTTQPHISRHGDSKGHQFFFSIRVYGVYIYIAISVLILN